jgi:hypothetical protein
MIPASGEMPLKTMGPYKIIPMGSMPHNVFCLRANSTAILTESKGANPELMRMTRNMETWIEGRAVLSAAALEITKEKGDNHGEIGANFYEVYSKSEHKGEGNC